MTTRLFSLAAALIVGGIAAFMIGSTIYPTHIANGHADYLINPHNPVRVAGLLAAGAGVLVLFTGVARFVADR